MEKKTSKEFALYRLERAKDECETAKLLYKENRLLASNNRAYYSIFYAIRAVLVIEKIDFKRHKDVLSYFNKNYVKTEIFPRQIGRRIIMASKIREDSDYDEKYEPNAEATCLQIETAEELIKLVEEYLAKTKNIIFSEEKNPFYSEKNIKRLKKSINQMEKSGGIIHEVEEID